MNKRRTLWLISQSLIILMILIMPSKALGQGIEGDIANGKSLFNQCAACHKIDKKMIGPALGDVTERRTAEWLIAWIRDNSAFRATGDADAIAVFEEYNESVMPSFPQFTDQDIMDILAYTVEANKPKEVIPGETADASTTAVGSDNSTMIYILGAILLGLVFLLAKVKNTLKSVQGESTTTLTQDANLFTRTALKSPKVITVLTILIAVVFFQQLYVNLMNVNVDSGYQPSQPIKFSHELHAGQNQIDCNYCHSGARKSKHSNIPSANVCMNCHMQVAEGPKYGTEEIAKIYDAVGWDPEAYAYKENYEQKPIKWVRIHKLPDLAYFNHSQHVTVGQIACQTCHGPIEEMEEVYQYSPLTMGWCIECHRETKVQMDKNDYYKEMHANLKDKYGSDADITVEMIGGLECGKCHY
jgi:cytochrome c2